MKANEIAVEIIGGWSSKELTENTNKFLKTLNDCEIITMNFSTTFNGSENAILRTYEIIYKK